MRKLFSVVLCLCLCASLSSCQTQEIGSGVNDSYLEGINQGELESFIDLWDSHYNGNVRSCGKTWETDDFSLVIETKRGSKIDAGVMGSENDPYLDIDITLHEGTIDNKWKNNKMLFYIYSQGEEGGVKIWGSDDYYWYFFLQTDKDTVGNTGNAETRIYEDTECLAVIVIIDGCTYTASYNVKR